MDLPGPPPAGTTHIRVGVAAPAARETVRVVLGSERRTWLGAEAQPAAGPGLERYAVDLEMPLAGSDRVALRKAALVDLGPVSEVAPDGPLCTPISWRAASLAPMFPVFSGHVCWLDGELWLEGWYAPPGGVLGAAADRMLLRLVADRTGRWLLSRVARAAGGDEPGQSRSSR